MLRNTSFQNAPFEAAGPAGPSYAHRTPGLFRSFWIAGYEGADHINGSGHALDMNRANQHYECLSEDYSLLAPFGIRTVRESIGWRLTEHGSGFDWSRLSAQIEAAKRQRVQVIWTLMHYGWPVGLDPFSPSFVTRFARYCENTARTVRRRMDEPQFYQPINEISFLSWAVCETSLIHPYDGSLKARAYELKRRLVAAALAGTEAILSVDPRARIVHTDPLCHIAPPLDRPELADMAADIRAYQFQAWDMLIGRTEPQLGGSRRHLDIIGFNHYHSSQWECVTDRRLEWHLKDPRRRPLSDLTSELWARYERPMFIAETSHVGAGRGEWLDDIAAEVIQCERRGVPLEGVCLYPTIDRPDWENPRHWHRSGLWDVAGGETVPGESKSLKRVLCMPYAERLRYWQAHYPQSNQPKSFAEQSSVSEGLFMSTIIVFSHLRWNFVYQRPQHLLSRLADQYQILFVEEPVHDERSCFLERFTPSANVEVLRPHVTTNMPGFHDDHLPELRRMLTEFMLAHGIDDYLVWFYTPMALPLARELAPRAVIYDCMDELTAFKNAPRQLVQRENALFKVADLVFTGGTSLYESKRDRHASVHCFPSSVDAQHFAPKSDRKTDVAADHPAQQGIAHPRFGYCGVIDERIDINLIDALARSHPKWQLVMVGPVAKIDAATLPKHPNVHWLGQHSYAELPQFIANWDVCLLPFALNDATRFISPTKTLEYMAAERPIVSTPIKDVVRAYANVVRIAALPDEFIAACEAALNETEQEQQVRREAMRFIVASTSWDETARAMAALIANLPTSRRTEAAHAVLPSLATGASTAPITASYDTIVLGAGPTGLAAAYHLGRGSLLIERQATVGGWCRSIVDNGFTFDYAGHIMFSADPYVLKLYELLLSDNLHWQNREAWIYSKNVYTRYPFQGALFGLPPEVLKECLVGAIEARFGPLKKENRRAVATAATQSLSATGAASSAASALVTEARPPQNFEEFIYKVWGAGVAKHFAIPYNRKLWAVPLNEMETSWLGGRVPMPDLEEMIDGALQPVAKPMGPNARFGYPLRGGFQALMNGFLPLLEGELQLNADVVAVSPSRRTVTLADGKSYRFETLISTLPLPKLVEALGEEAPEFVRVAARALRHVSVRCVNLGVGREAITDKHWIYYPEATVFHRIFVQGNASPYCNPPGGFGLTCEITYSEYKPLPCDGEALIRRCIDDCVRVGMIGADDPILAANQVDMPYAYVVYDHARAANVQTIRSWLADARILLAGRYSEWEYYNSDHAFVAGKKAAERALELNANNARSTSGERVALSDARLSAAQA